MKIASVADVKSKLSAYLREAETKAPVVITRNGRSVAVLIAPENEEDLEDLLLSRSHRFRSLLAKSRSNVKAGKGLSHRDFWKSVK